MTIALFPWMIILKWTVILQINRTMYYQGGWKKVIHSMSMDKVDWQILESLEADGRESFGAIAEKVSLSKTPCWTRVQSLERSGAIKGYRAVIDPYAVGLKLTAFVEVTIEFGSRVAFEKAVALHPAIIECYTTAGGGDYLLQVMTGDVERLDGLLREELCRLPGVQRSATTVCLKRIKDNGPITGAAALLRQ